VQQAGLPFVAQQASFMAIDLSNTFIDKSFDLICKSIVEFWLFLKIKVS